MDKIRVLIIAKATPSSGGTYNYTRSVIKQLSQSDDLDVRVISLHCAIGEDSASVAKYSFINVVSSIFRQRRFDVVLCPTYFLPLFLFRIPKFVTIHDFQERYLTENFSLLQRLWRRFTHFVTELASPTYICETEYVKRDIMKFVGVISARISVVKAPALVAEFNSSLTITGNTFRDIDIFYPAKFWKHKNHTVILKALAYC